MNDIRTDAAGLGAQSTQVGSGQGVGAERGVYKGAEVTVIDQKSLLADAAEELTQELSEDAEKELSKREVEDGHKSESLLRLIKVKEVSQLLDQLGDLKQQDLFRGLKALIQQQGKGARHYREQAAKQFEQPEHQYALLTAHLEALKQRGADSKEIAEAQAAVDSLMQEHGAEIRGALNIAEAANEYAQDTLGDQGDLRAAYQANTKDYADMASALADLTERFGEKDLQKAIDFMTKALGLDLSAGGPSVDKAKLNIVLNDLHRMKTLTTVLENCEIVAHRARGNGASLKFTGTKLMQQLVPLIDARRLRAKDVEALPDAAGLKALDGRINFFNDTKELVNQIPPKAFSRDDSQTKLKDAIQEALDDAITTEEDLEEA